MVGTVYILGAGASRAETFKEEFPTPLANDFSPRDILMSFGRQ